MNTTENKLKKQYTVPQKRKKQSHKVYIMLTLCLYFLRDLSFYIYNIIHKIIKTIKRK